VIAGTAILTLLAAFVRQESSEYDEMPFRKVAEQIWVLWDLQVEQGSPLAPTDLEPTSPDKMLLSIPLPPGWRWVFRGPHRRDIIPGREWKVKTAGSFFPPVPLGRAIEMMLMGRASSEGLYVHFGRGREVLHPGWTEKMLTDLQIEALEQMWKASSIRQNVAVRELFESLFARLKASPNDSELLGDLFDDINQQIRDKIAPVHGVRGRRPFILLRQVASDYNSPLLTLRDILADWTWSKTGDQWGSSTWVRMVEAGTATWLLDRIRERLMAAELGSRKDAFRAKITEKLKQVTRDIQETMQREGWYYGPSRDARHDLPTPWHINAGWCDQWAWLAQERVGGEVFGLPDPYAHDVLFLDGLYYDSQHPEGVHDWRHLDLVRGVSLEQYMRGDS
jgi:hypothetical protein